MNDFKVLTPAEAEALLQRVEARHPEMVSFLALALFGGIRPADIKLLDWKQVNLNRAIIEVTEAKSGRIVLLPINSTLHAWLTALGKPEGPVAPNLSVATLLKRLRQSALDAGLDSWTHRSLRRTFVSYGSTAYTSVDPKHAELFWALTPACLYPTEEMISILEL